MIAATSVEYCDSSMILFASPNSAEIVPKVNPDAISNVVYIASLCGDPNARAMG